MARFASAAVLLAAALLMAGRLTHADAEPSTAEVFWPAVLPASAVPDAVLQLLRPAMTTSPEKRPANQASGGVRDDDLPFDTYILSGYNDVSSERSTTRGGGGIRNQPSAMTTSPAKRPARQGQASGGVRDDDDIPLDTYKLSGYDDVASERSTTRGGGGVPGTPTATATSLFFHEEAVRVGERLPLHLRAAAPTALGLLPRAVADSIPFTTAALPAVLALLGVPPGSSRAAAMAETLRTCERRTAPVAGEVLPPFCATSLEAMVERAVAALGTRDVRAVTSAVPRAGLPLQEYAVRAVQLIGGGGGASFVGCHDKAYPYTVYFCHGTGPARAYLVEMEAARGGGGGAVTVAFVCHTDTSRWNPEHVSFKVLGTKPGGKPVCHLMPYGHIIWTKNDVKPSPA